MAGFDNEVLYADNYDFRGVSPIVAQVTAQGQLPIGTGASPAIKVGKITSTTLSVGYSDPNITIEAGTTVPTSFQTNSGTATPSANVLQILGGQGATTSGASNVITIDSVKYTDQGSSTSVAVNSGSFSTAAITLTLPASPTNGQVCEFIATTADVLIIQLPGTQVAHLGNVATSAGGTITTTAIGDSITLKYQSSAEDWWGTSSVGVLVLA